MAMICLHKQGNKRIWVNVNKIVTLFEGERATYVELEGRSELLCVNESVKDIQDAIGRAVDVP